MPQCIPQKKDNHVADGSAFLRGDAFHLLVHGFREADRNGFGRRLFLHRQCITIILFLDNVYFVCNVYIVVKGERESTNERIAAS